ncbi:hypothetical protein A2619_01140 [candidate division WWE3 bacterium RIFOXYD1_FULL_39_9]|uniref:Uncharacterized protein n=1 Tax=candidate division WWE3 bacterium RIFOXYD1_FULL_39_9 TaxID=1802649 RepID=A0A1F4X6L5_UNCKA|nr:MAG: hypothetical protein A2619_01140 [candidate division WWE3 bacterium RIFOXYD1_FULL_39_9]
MKKVYIIQHYGYGMSAYSKADIALTRMHSITGKKFTKRDLKHVEAGGEIDMLEKHEARLIPLDIED